MIPSRRVEPLDSTWSWQLSAACRGMDSELFYYTRQVSAHSRHSQIETAKAICRTCRVVPECLDHALRNSEPYGVWGGRSEDERARMLGRKTLQHPARRTDGESAPLMVNPNPGT